MCAHAGGPSSTGLSAGPSADFDGNPAATTEGRAPSDLPVQAQLTATCISDLRQQCQRAKAAASGLGNHFLARAGQASNSAAAAEEQPITRSATGRSTGSTQTRMVLRSTSKGSPVGKADARPSPSTVCASEAPSAGPRQDLAAKFAEAASPHVAAQQASPFPRDPGAPVTSAAAASIPVNPGGSTAALSTPGLRTTVTSDQTAAPTSTPHNPAAAPREAEGPSSAEQQAIPDDPGLTMDLEQILGGLGPALDAYFRSPNFRNEMSLVMPAVERASSVLPSSSG